MSAIDDIHEDMAWEKVTSALTYQRKLRKDVEHQRKIDKQRKIYNHPKNRLSRLFYKLAKKLEYSGD